MTKGILFKPDMIKAIVERRKTQTRRVIKPRSTATLYDGSQPDWVYVEAKPRYQVGETVYIKEKITRKRNGPSVGYDYATYALDLTPVMFYLSANRFVWRWQKDYLSPLHLPQEAARYFIQITDVRAERLQKITAEDCKVEGIFVPSYPEVDIVSAPKYRQAYLNVWNEINGKTMPWICNPWVWVYSFREVSHDKTAGEK